MIKKNKLKVIISSSIIMFPALFGIIMWNKLPDMFTTHWGADGNADRMAGKAFAVFGIPLIFLSLHFLTLLLSSLDKRQKDQHPKALGIIFWILPVLSLFISIVLYSVALEREINLEILLPIMLGISFILMGNYMPKVKQNSTLGIKVSWALRNEENWNKTHRFGGKLMVACGFIIMLSAILPFKATFGVLICVIASFAVATVIYSYLVFKKHQNSGIEYAPRVKVKGEKISAVIAGIAVPMIIITIVIIMFTGNIEVDCGDASIKIDATYWSGLEIDYSEIDTVTYRKELDVGIKTNGFGSARLSLGTFKNDEFGSYTIYAYNSAKEYAVLTSGDKTLVIGMSDMKDTQAIYNTVSEKTGGK